jgi:uncharacterized membrane protein
MDFVFHVVVAGVIFVLIDSVWLGVVANKLYKRELGGMLRDKPDFIAAGIFYVLYIVGLVVFALQPALDDDSLSRAIGNGALLGLVMYATYDLTNKATLKNWSTKITIVDLIWGAIITGAVSALSYLIFH